MKNRRGENMKIENANLANEGASAVSYTLLCHSKERRGTEPKYEKMHENFDRSEKIVLKRRKFEFNEI